MCFYYISRVKILISEGYTFYWLHTIIDLNFTFTDMQLSIDVLFTFLKVNCIYFFMMFILIASEIE